MYESRSIASKPLRSLIALRCVFPGGKTGRRKPDNIFWATFS